MGVSVSDILIDLAKITCVVVVFAYLVTRTRFFTDLLEKRASLKSQAIMILLFGALSIFGTYGGLSLPSGAIANVRDLGPMLAGFAGGPVVGVGAGLIGGIQRYFMGGFVAVPCSLATVIAGLAGGMVYIARKGTFPRVWQAALFAVGMELFHMGLTLLMAKPFDDALAVVKEVVLPMTAANAIGAAIFAFMVWNLTTERKTAAEKEKYRAELERKKFEIETARKIQQSFLPESTPTLEGFDIAAFSLPALEVGGDFYDFVPICPGKWGLVIADVSGKGFPAALFMALSRTCVRANAMGNATVSEAIRTANRLICQDAKSGMFVTLFYAVLDLDNRQLHYVNAGHNPPLYFKGGGGDVVLLGAEGIALGVVEDINLQEVKIELSSNDTVVLYTDGVTEAIDRKGEQFGKERLVTLVAENSFLPAQDLVNKIKSEVTAFTQGQDQFDDLTLVTLKSV